MGKQIMRYAEKKKYIRTSFLVAQLGSNWNNGSNTGTFYWNLNNSSSNRNRNISSRAVNALEQKPC